MRVILNLGLGSIKEGFPHITAQIWSSDEPLPSQIIGSLPPRDTLSSVYQNWRNDYVELQRNNFLRIKQTKPSRQVAVRPFSDQCNRLENEFSQWLSSPGFNRIESYLRTHLSIEDEICIFLETDLEDILHLPWHLWRFLEDFKKAEIVLSNPEYNRKTPPTIGLAKVRILAIFGNERGLNLAKDRTFLERLPNTDLVFLSQPSLEELHNALYDEIGYDILFYAGHSGQEERQGYLELNQEEIISISQIKLALEKACNYGLQLAIFNSCDGLALAQKLASLNIPQTIVMREPIPDLVAEKFLEHFLPLLAKGKSTHLAIRQARERLEELDNKYLCATWLPVLYQNPSEVSRKWHQLGRTRILNQSDSPYKGLLSFQEEDAAFFYGRTKLVEYLYQLLPNQPILPILGVSGSGKSSLVAAGLIPLLKTENWEVISLRPTDNPLHSLAEAFGLKETDLRNNPHELYNHLQQAQKEKLLVFVDQLEELYSLCPLPGERELFLDQLLNLGSNYRWIFTLRADFLGQILAYRPLADLLQNRDVKISQMNDQELQEIIELPAQRVGVSLENGLPQRLITDIQGEIGYLPLLQFTLKELWDNREQKTLTHSAYQNLGGVKQSITRHADRIYNQLSPDHKLIARQLFLCLVRINPDRSSTRRRVLKQDLVNLSPLSNTVINQLAEKKLLILTDHHVELVHESLLEYWGLLKGWIEENFQELSFIQRLEQEASHWQSLNSPLSPEYLLQGSKLLQAVEFSSSSTKFSEVCRDYIKISQKQSNSRKSRRFRLIGLGVVLVTGTLLGIVIQLNKQSFERYYSQTVPRVQTVQFNMLFNTLPYKLSEALIRKDSNEVKAILESNYGLFGLVLTDCKKREPDCPEEKIIYSSGRYLPNNPQEIKAILSQHPYDLLQDPPPFHATQYYESPRAFKTYPTGLKNPGTIIGRVYYIRDNHSPNYWTILKQSLFNKPE